MVTKQDYLYVIFGSKDKGFEFTGASSLPAIRWKSM